MQCPEMESGAFGFLNLFKLSPPTGIEYLLN